MDENEIKVKLEKLNELRHIAASYQRAKQEKIDSILTPEIKQSVALVEEVFNRRAEDVNKEIAALEENIKKAAVDLGHSVKSVSLQVVWNKGRITWNTTGLDGYAVGHPEILFMRKEGEPYAIIR